MALSTVNAYEKLLNNEQIEKGLHRGMVGGNWEAIGKLQFQFLLKQGLKPDDRLLDIGCGCLRGGLHFINFLQNKNYFGLDYNDSLITAGRLELEKADLIDKQPLLLVSKNFELNKFECKFKFMISVSLFTHLPINMILRCLVNVKSQLTNEGSYYSSFFEVANDLELSEYKHDTGGFVTHFDKDPYHYSYNEMKAIAEKVGLKVDYLGDWGHPFSQKMLRFYR
tara:strand:- start:9201 stop:9872 length:672 start_codon:yes stop_codon:yes gene_type:complete